MMFYRCRSTDYLSAVFSKVSEMDKKRKKESEISVLEEQNEMEHAKAKYIYPLETQAGLGPVLYRALKFCC